ncbi:metalloregulator ArsR/SmtB family transcription factor [Bacterioplanoides pacificum]|uniref:Metalloregulator ArsR/SmtB family transcription factor n=1 Tax=Bacterioplanoides pacificum TaxID=1171596 RepID=A0ABV7VNZ3_9GAMM
MRPDVVQPQTLFKCMSDETRLALLLLIEQHGELCVCELTEALQLSQPKVSRHLAQLRECELLQGEKRGQWVHYSLHPQLDDWAKELIAHTLTHNAEFLTDINQRLCKVSPQRAEQTDCC